MSTPLNSPVLAPDPIKTERAMKATALAHPNIALVKYWGKRDEALNLPVAGSLSLTLAGLHTETSVVFQESLQEDQILLDGRLLKEGRARQRVVEFLNLVRKLANRRERALVESSNDFPTAAGLASSASGFAALALAATTAAGLSLSREELSVLARRGSGSAARSLFGGFAEMKAGELPDGSDAHAVAVAEKEHWDLRALIALTATGAKEVGSTEGMRRTQKTSPLFQAWADTVDDDIGEARKAIWERNFEELTQVAERSCLRMHATAIGADPGILYWNPTTVAVIQALRRARDEEGWPLFFTIDAGPHVKVFTLPETEAQVEQLLGAIPGVEGLVSARPGGGARLIPEK